MSAIAIYCQLEDRPEPGFTLAEKSGSCSLNFTLRLKSVQSMIIKDSNARAESH
jgi:hypothetical protein